MAPEIVPITPRPEWRLKVVIQANALVDALLAAVCMAARGPIADLFGFPSPTISIVIGFVLAFSSAFMFRITVKEVPRRLANLGAVGNACTALVLGLIIVFNLFNLSRLASIILACVAAVHALFGIVLIALLNSSGQGYNQPDVVAV